MTVRRLAVPALLVALVGGLLGVAPRTAVAAENRTALIIGVRDYAGRTSDTVGGYGDAVDVRDALLRSGWRAQDIRVLVDGAATAQAIRDGLWWLHSRSGPQSFTVFHYSGHVKQLGGDRDRDGEAVDEYLWGSDNQLVADGELAIWLKALAGNVWVDIAGCEAAGFDDGVSSPTRLFTASSHEHQKSYEYPEKANSIFTWLLVDQGILQGKAPRGSDNRISIQEAFSLASRHAPEYTARQSKGPQNPYIAGGTKHGWHLDTGAAPPSANAKGSAPGQKKPKPFIFF